MNIIQGDINDQNYKSIKNIANLLKQVIDWINSGAPLSTQNNIPLTGDTVYSDSSSYMALNPSGALAALEVVLIPNPANGQIFKLNTTQDIAALTLITTDGSTIQGYDGSPVSVSANTTPVSYIFNKNQNQWLVN